MGDIERPWLFAPFTNGFFFLGPFPFTKGFVEELALWLLALVFAFLALPMPKASFNLCLPSSVAAGCVAKLPFLLLLKEGGCSRIASFPPLSPIPFYQGALAFVRCL